MTDENLHRVLFETAGDAILILHNGEIIDCNASAGKLLGRSAKKLRGQALSDFWATPSAAGLEEQKAALDTLVEGDQRRVEWRLQPINGETLVVQGALNAIEVKGERYIQAILRDVTTHKTLETQLRESETQYKTLFDNVPVAIYTKNREGIYTSVNKDTLKYWSQNPQGHTDLELLAPQTGRALRQNDLMVMESGQEQILEETIDTPDGKRVVLSRKLPTRDAQGQINGLLGISIDITQRKQVEDELQRQRAYLRQVIDINPSFIFAKDRQGRFTLANEAFARAYQTTPDDIIGKTDADFHANQDLVERYNRDDLSVIETGQELSFDDQLVTNVQGMLVWRKTVKRPIVDENGLPYQMLGVSTDITAIKRTEERLARINEVFLNLSQVSAENIDRLTALCGELLGAAAAAYNRLDNNQLCAIAGWQVPLERASFDKPDGRICYDVIKSGQEEAMVVRHLQDSIYAATDPYVRPNAWQTYLGHPVKVQDMVVGSLCATFQADLEPAEGDKRIMGILASAIGVEEERRLAEEARRETDAWLRTLISALPDITFVKDETGRYVDILADERNPLYQGAASLLKGKTIHDLLPPTTVELFMKVIQQVLASGEPQVVDYFLDLPPGGPRWYQGRVSPMPAIPGELRRVVWVAYDITERKNLEIKIEESLERRGRQVQLSTHIAQVIATATNLDDLYHRVVTEVNTQFGYFHVQLFSYEAESEMLKLAAGYGDIGQQMLAENYQIPKGVGLAGQAVALGQSILRPDLEQQPDSVPHPLLARAKGAIAVPVKLGETVLGVLSAKVEQPNVLDEEDQLVLEGLCGQIAIAIENTRLLQQVQRRAVELQTVAQVSAIVSTTLAVDKLLQTVVDLTKVRFNLYHAHIYLADEFQDTLVLTAGADQVGRQMVEQGWRIPVSRADSLVVQAFRRQAGVVSNEVETDPGFMPNPLLPETRSELAVPLLIGKRVLGVLDVQSNRSNRFSDDDLQIMSTLATQVAIALENARLFEEERKFAASIEGQVTRLSLLNEMGAALSAVSSTQEAIELAARKTVEVIEGDRVTVTLLDPAGQHLEYYAIQGIGGPLVENLAVAETLTGQALTSGKVMVISDLAQEEHPSARKLGEQGLQSLLIAPLIGWGRALGAINISSRQRKAYDARDEGLAQQIGSLLASTIENRRLFEQTQIALAETETLYDLTGILSTASSLDKVLQVVVSPDIHPHIAQAALFTINVDPAGRPEELILAASWNRDSEYETLISGVRYQAQAYPGAEIWLENPQDLLLVDDVSRDERLTQADRALCTDFGARAFVQLPLRLGPTWVGLISLHWTVPQQFSQRDARLYQSLAYQTAVVVNNLLLLEQTQTTLTEVNLLYRVAQAIAQMDDDQAIYEFVLQAYLKVLGLPQGGVLVTDDRDPYFSTLRALMINGQLVEAGMRVPMKGNPASELVIKTKKPVAVADALSDPLLAPVRDFVLKMGYKSLLLVPIVVRDQVFGVLGADSTEDIHEFTEHEIALVQGIADQLGVAIENRRLLVETRAALAEVKTLQRRYTVQAWEAYRARSEIKGYERIGDVLMPVSEKTEADIERILLHKRRTIVPGMPPLGNGKSAGQNGQEKSNALVVPLKVRDETVGLLGVEARDGQDWTPEEVAFIEAIAEQMAQAAENIRLLDETQQQAARERRVNEISEKIQAAQSLEEALQIAVKEVGLSLQVPQVTVEFDVEE